MLACPGVMPAPRNQWYIAALSSEVSRKVMTRQILQDHIVFFRTEDGTAVALGDRCPHRGVPLSMGTVQGMASAVRITDSNSARRVLVRTSLAIDHR